MYNAPRNGLAEMFDKTLCNLLQRWWKSQSTIGTSKLVKQYMHIGRSTKHQPRHALVYGVEAVLPLELQINPFNAHHHPRRAH